MPEGISPNSLNDISKVYLDQIAAFREVRKQETQKDIERWSQGADPTATQKEEVQVDEEKKALPKLKMYRKAGNLARAGDEKSMKRQTKIVSTLNKETSKGYKKAALAKLRDGGSPKHQKEDKAFANVVAALKKKHGDAGVLSSKKDFDDHKKREVSKPKPKAQPQKPLTDKEKAHREVVARYGGESNYKAGRGLGT